MEDIILVTYNYITVCLFVIMNLLDSRNFEHGKFHTLTGLKFKRNKLTYFKTQSPAQSLKSEQTKAWVDLYEQLKRSLINENCQARLQEV